jgi:hypothetical protein
LSPSSAITRRSSGTGRGVVVTTSRGDPSRNPIIRLSQAASARRSGHFASSSAQAKLCSGPRKPSGASAE